MSKTYILQVSNSDVPQLGMDPGSSTRSLSKNGFKSSWTGVFFIFCQFFGVFDDFSNFHSSYNLLHIEKSSNIPKKKKWRKDVRCSTTHFSLVRPKPTFWVPDRDPSLVHKMYDVRANSIINSEVDFDVHSWRKKNYITQ